MQAMLVVMLVNVMLVMGLVPLLGGENGAVARGLAGLLAAEGRAF